MAMILIEEQSDPLLVGKVNSTEVTRSEISNKQQLIKRGSGGISKWPFTDGARSCYLLPSRHQCLFHLTSLIHIILSVALMVTIPHYTKSSAIFKSDIYSSLFFVVVFSTIILLILMSLRKFWDPSYCVLDRLPFLVILSNSLVFTVSLLGLSYSREENRIPCHLQDGIIFLAIPFVIIYMAFKKRKDNLSDDRVKLIVCLTVCMTLVFLSTILDLASKHKCRGVIIDTEKDVEPSGTNVPWMLIYCISIGLLTCSVASFLSFLQDYDSYDNRNLEWTTWTHTFVTIELICLFWTDIFPSVGGANNLEDFWSKFSRIWTCHFSDSCATSAKLGFQLAIFWLLFLYCSSILVKKFQSNPVHIICNTCLALPILPVFYDMFTLELSEIHLTNSIGLGGIVGVLTFPAAYIFVYIYHQEQRVLNLMDKFDIL